MRRRFAATGLAALLAGGLLVSRDAVRAAPSLDERWLFEQLNARRRALARAPLQWDPLAHDVLRAMDAATWSGEPGAADRLARQVEARRGYAVSWSAAVARGPELSGVAPEALDTGLLAEGFTHGAVLVASVPRGASSLAVAAAYACALPKRWGRAQANGPAGTYLVRCAACGHERSFRFGSPRGPVNFDCPACRSRMLPYLDDPRGALHWPTHYARPYAPLPVENPFLAWQWVNNVVAYDRAKADDDRPGWQTPAETVRTRRGVCRDTAVLLVAWLRAMGHEARVVSGLSDGAPHAWVLLEVEGTRYLLESAYEGGTPRYPPRLELARGYLPTGMMFDDRRVLLNLGQQPTRDYDSAALWRVAEEQP